ncbi:hypothetical protein ACFFL1_04465 [Samsonia erythrinae]|uniref:Uncharacterized protein n=1 Tax=Samsonia erythrinae TaxID=160434 RepID=A0A4R3VRW4_9GAMM|nr:hypothetical protein [Samsonia erythrinae]TCV08749.1 hypothetical protein EDC54_101257 [Samsonia erythrinae]
MENTKRRCKFSMTGMMLGALALFVSISNFWGGSSTPDIPLEERIAAEIVSIRDTTVDRFMGKPAPVPIPETTFNTQQHVTTATSALGCLALILAIFGFARREPGRTCISAAALGLAAIVFPFVIGAIGIVILCIAFASLLSGVTLILG